MMEFPTTRWTQLAQATLHGDNHAASALENFCQRYREPVIRLLRHRGVQEDRVEDMTHDFFIRLMESSALKRADPARGRFRSFLSGALNHFLADDFARNQAVKRGGGIYHVSLDESAESSVTGPLSEEDNLFLDREWALNIMESAVEEIANEWTADGKETRFDAIRPFLPGASHAADYEEAGRLTGLSSGSIRMEIYRLRNRFREIVRSRVAATVASPLDVDDELNHLHSVLTAPSSPFI